MPCRLSMAMVAAHFPGVSERTAACPMAPASRAAMGGACMRLCRCGAAASAGATRALRTGRRVLRRPVISGAPLSAIIIIGESVARAGYARADAGNAGSLRLTGGSIEIALGIGAAGAGRGKRICGIGAELGCAEQVVEPCLIFLRQRVLRIILQRRKRIAG